ncbi:MAG: type II secretion system protein [Phycisphaerales bacterium]|nr:type II secretion system protein [Phycisphaerales bacterium]
MVRHRKRKRGPKPRWASAARRGFTLLEMLLVISIIALLLALLIPGMVHAMRQANGTVCMHNLREIGQALHIYRLENEGWLPNVDVDSRNKVSTWFVKLFPKPLTDYATVTCPEDPFKGRFRALRDQKDDALKANASSYGLNNFLLRAGGGYLSNVDRFQPALPMNTLLVADIGPDHHGTTTEQGKDKGPPRNASMLQWDDGYDPFYEEAGYPWVTKRHGVGINILTLGNSVVQAKTADVMRNPIRSYYPRCANGGCSLCTELEDLPHYNFSEDQLYWYTGPLPFGDHEVRR